MEKNQELVGTVEGIGSNGEGLIKQDGFIVFVPFALMGEKIKYKVLKTIEPSKNELDDNNRARSAKLRIIERIGR